MNNYPGRLDKKYNDLNPTCLKGGLNENLKKILIFLFFPCLLSLSSLREIYSIEGLAGSGEKFEIELDVKTEKDLLLLNEIGLDCPGLGVCTCQADTSQLLSLKKANYNFRPSKRLHSDEQSQGIKQSRIIQLKIDIKDEAELNIIKSLGLDCNRIGKCTTEVNIEQMTKIKQNRISFSGIREGIRVEGTSSPEGIHSETFKPAGFIYGENETDYPVPWVSWVYSPITIDNAPYDATVKELEVTYYIYDADGQINYLAVDLTNESISKEYRLWNYEGNGSYIYETEKDTTFFDGESVNQTWKLYVWDSFYPGGAIILFWNIKLWFSGPPVHMVNHFDYAIPEEWDSVSSPITVTQAPPTARVTSTDIHYDIIHTYVGDLEIWVTDNDHSAEYMLWEYEGGSNDDIHETVTGITHFNGELVNQTWRMWASDCCTWDQGYIDFWSITLWYQDLPDLVIKSMKPSNYNPFIDSTISLDMVIKNQGTREAGSFYAGLYYNLSYPPDIYTYENQWQYISGLNPGDTQVVTFTGVTSADTGTWNMYGMVDSDDWEEESDENNNYIGPKTVKWRDISSLPDLIIEEAWVSNDCNPTLDESVYVDVVIRNIGGSSTPFLFYTAIYYNREAAPDPTTPEDNWYPTGGHLYPDAIDTFTFVLPNPSYAETWIMWLLVDSDDQAAEVNENNNVFGPIYVYWGQPAFKTGTITRAQIIENALKFVNILWTCPPINGISKPCTKPGVNEPAWTSDYIVGVGYTGEPYEWGGWDPPGDPTNNKCFLYYVDNNLKRAGVHSENDCLPDSLCNPPWSTGTDCSGLVSRAWQLNSKHNCSMLKSVSDTLPTYYSLKRGDALISTCANPPTCNYKHTFIFNEWVRPDTMQVIEARSNGVGNPSLADTNTWTCSTLVKYNYKPYKYKDVIEDISSIPGDVNGDSKVSVSDVVFLIGYLFKGGLEPNPLCRADVNWDYKVSLSDVVYLINYLFKGGPTPWNAC